MPATWKQYGVDANRDGLEDPYNPVDAIFAAARYLRAAGAETDIRRAIFAYNHADWYVDSVLMRARLIGGLPSNFVGSLTGLTQGRFPVHAKATYAGQVEKSDKKARRRPARTPRSSSRPTRTAAGSRSSPAAARPWSPSTTAGSCARARPSASASSSSSRTPTATPTPTGTSARSPRPTPRRSRARRPRSKIAKELELAERRRQADRRRLGDRPQRPRADAPRRARSRRTKRARRAHHRPPPCCRPPRPPSSACSPTPRARTRWPRAATAQLGGPPIARRLGPDRPRRHATSSRSRSRRARASSPARSSAASARPTRPRPRTSSSSSARPAAAPRASIRSRSSTAGSCSSRPRSTAPRARTRSSATTPSSPRSARSC